jgi:transglutaminase-like putative cysteine protease
MVAIKALLDLLTTAAALLCLAPVLPFLELPALLLAAAAVAGGYWCDRRGRYPLPALPATLLALGGVTWYSLQISRADVATPTVHALVVLLAVRLLTAKQARDYLQIFILALFILAGSSLLSLEAGFILYLVLLVFVITVSLVLLTVFVTDPRLALPRRDLWRLLRVALLMPAAALVLMLGFFVILPRTAHPLWSFLNSSGRAVAGLSESVSPGAFAQLAAVKSPAFRAEGAELPVAELYWRVLVLNHPEGTRWVRREPPAEGTAQVTGGQPLTFTIYPEPRSDRYLVTLERPLQVGGVRNQLSPDQVFRGAAAGEQRFRYTVQSSPGAELRVSGRTRHDFYLVAPAQVSTRVAASAAQIAASGESTAARLAALAAFFRERQLTYAQEDLPGGLDPIDSFLFEQRRGYCEFFASAYVTLARLAGVPARLVGGYHGGEYNPLGGYYLVTDDTAHVWAEVLTAAGVWQRVDPSQWATNAGTAKGARSAPGGGPPPPRPGKRHNKRGEGGGGAGGPPPPVANKCRQGHRRAPRRWPRPAAAAHGYAQLLLGAERAGVRPRTAARPAARSSAHLAGIPTRSAAPGWPCLRGRDRAGWSGGHRHPALAPAPLEPRGPPVGGAASPGALPPRRGGGRGEFRFERVGGATRQFRLPGVCTDLPERGVPRPGADGCRIQPVAGAAGGSLGGSRRTAAATPSAAPSRAGAAGGGWRGAVRLLQSALPDGHQVEIATADLHPVCEELKGERSGRMVQETPLAAMAAPAAETVTADHQLPRLVAHPVGNAEVAAVQVEFQPCQFQHFTDRPLGDGGTLTQEAAEEERGQYQRFADLGAGAGAGVDPVQQGERGVVTFVASQQRLEQATGLCLAKHLAGDSMPEQLQQLFADARRCSIGNQRRTGIDAFARGLIKGKPEPGGKFQGPEHAHRIFGETDQRVTNHPQAARLEVDQPADVIDDAEGADIVKQGVDGEVAAEGILARGAEDVLHHEMMIVRVLGEIVTGRLATECGNLHQLVSAKAHMGQAEAPADQVTVAEQPLDLLRRSIRTDVEVLGGALEQQVAHTAANQVGQMAGAMQPVQNAQGVGVDSAARQAMLGAGQDHRLVRMERLGWHQGHRLGRLHSGLQNIFAL